MSEGKTGRIKFWGRLQKIKFSKIRLAVQNAVNSQKIEKLLHLMDSLSYEITKPLSPLEKFFYKKYLFYRNRQTLLMMPFERVNLPVDKVDRRLKGISRKKRVLFSKVKLYNDNIAIIKGGNWRTVPLENYHHYRAFKQRFVEGYDWEDTLYYSYFHKKKGASYRGCNSWKEFKRKVLARWDGLYNRIDNGGFKAQSELEGVDCFFQTDQNNTEGDLANEVHMAIGAEGEIYQSGNGVHRFIIAQLLGLEQIPAVITVWHRDYIESLKSQENINLENLTPARAIKPLTS